MSSDFIITFNNDNSDLWAFDRKNSQYEASPMFMAEYETQNGYDIPWKLIPAGKSGKVTATISKGSPDQEKVKFYNSKGTEYFAEFENGEFKITLLGGENGDGQHIYAVYQPGDSSTLTTVGRLSIATYNMKLPKVKLVPVADAFAPSGEDMAKRINDIYLPYGVEWKVEMLPAHQDMSWDDGDKALAKGYGFFSMYSDEMKALNKSFQQRSEYQADAVYLFLMNAIAGEEETELLGDMPVGSQFGYLLSKNAPDQLSRTIAHELGHGLFQLWHTFSDKYNIPQSSTANLMDYNSGSQLVKHQWDVMHDPQKMLFKWLQGEEEGDKSIFKSRLSLVHYNDSSLAHNQNLYFLPEINEEITLKAKQTKNDVQEDVKVNWSYGDQMEITEITFTVNNEFFGDAEKIQIDVTEKVLLGSDSTLAYFIGKVDVSPEIVIDSILTNIKDIQEEFDSLAQVVSELKAENYDAISLQATSKYITQGLSDFYESPPDELLTTLDKVLAQMYSLDLLIKELENFDNLATEIATIYFQESSKQEFFNTVIEDLETINPLDTKENLETLYKGQIINTAFEKLAGRLNND